MRRLIAIVAALLVWQMSDARPIPEAQARRNAAEFFTAERGLTKAAAVRAEDLRLVYTFPESVTKAPADPALYVFDMPSGGYVIAAGDDVARKVLAYSLILRVTAVIRHLVCLPHWKHTPRKQARMFVTFL